MGVKIKVLLDARKRNRPLELDYGGGYFFTRDRACEDYDWLVVFDEMPVPFVGLRCPREQTILCTWEPVSIKSYSKAYTRQFGHLLSNRPPSAEKHPHYHLGRGYYRWFIGRSYEQVLSTVIPPKTKLVSVACSDKRMKSTAHDLRFRLAERLAKDIPGLDWFGHGIRGFDEKFEVMDSYRYHVAIENHIGIHHWTEKIADAWLSECLPFYAGDPDLGNVFPPESFIPIPIDDPAEAVRIVKKSVEAGEYENRRAAILEAKRLILSKYNFWSQVIEVIKASAGQRVTPVRPDAPARIYARRELRWHSPGAVVEDALSHLARFVGYRRTVSWD